MIAFEDIEFEKSVLDEHYHIAVPFVVTQQADGQLHLLVYSFCGKIAEEFEQRFTSDPFSEEAVAFLSERLTPIMAEMAYETGDPREHMSLVYQMTDRGQLNPACFKGRAKRYDVLTEKDKENSETEIFAFEINPTDELDRIFAICGTEGEIVAFAAINDIAEDSGFYELNVECTEEYRRRGYGSECVAALANYLLEHGVPVEYICTATNLPSIKTAEKVGFSGVRRSMPLVYYRIDYETEDDGAISF